MGRIDWGISGCLHSWAGILIPRLLLSAAPLYAHKHKHGHMFLQMLCSEWRNLYVEQQLWHLVQEKDYKKNKGFTTHPYV